MIKRYVNLIIPAVIWMSCSQQPEAQYTYQKPLNIDDGLRTGSLSDVNLNPAPISRAVDSIRQGKYKEVHSILIYKDDRLVFEEYFRGHKFKYDGPGHHGDLLSWDKSMPHRVMSVSKSITSACIGIAVDKGFIKNVQQPIFDYLPDFRQYNSDGKDKITVEHLLTMTSGLQGNEWMIPYKNPENDVLRIYFSQDPITNILSRPQTFKAGSVFQYFGGSNFLLSEILKNASGMNLEEFSSKYLFKPLRISSFKWLKLNKGVIDGAGGLIIKPRDMIKIGATFLHNGQWNGGQVISAQWIEKSAKAHPGNNWMNNWDDHWGMRGYAYSWWTHTFVWSGKKIDMYYAAGWGGQYIMVIPALETVIVFTGGNYTTFRPSFEILKKYILTAYPNE